MKITLALVALGIVVVLILLKRKFAQAKAAKTQAVSQQIQQAVLPEHKFDSNKTVEPKPANVMVAPEASAVVENKPEEQPTPATLQLVEEAKLPEDSTLRRHYLSNRDAERLAITHPYPTDSMLRRHYESGLAWLIKSVPVIDSSPVAETIKVLENSATEPQSVTKSVIPEDSTLRRHFLTQIQAEVETQLSPRPTDSALKRHYDNLVKSRVQAYLTADAA